MSNKIAKANGPKMVPVFFNVAQLANETGFPLSTVYAAAGRGDIIPDAITGSQRPLFLAKRLGDIAALLQKTEVVA